MNRKLMIAMGMLLTLASGVGFASTFEQITVKVPFDFTVQDKVMPAGSYEIYAADEADPKAWVVRSLKGTKEETLLTEEAGMKNPAPKTELVFDEVGNKRFLRQIWFEGEMSGRELIACNSEKAMQQKETHTSQRRIAGERSPHHKMSNHS